jgi:hypothetical protein
MKGVHGKRKLETGCRVRQVSRLSRLGILPVDDFSAEAASYIENNWSGREDLNLRLPAMKITAYAACCWSVTA